MDVDEQEHEYDTMSEGSDPVSHTEHKEDGNSAYKQKDYRTAIAHYTLAIETAKELTGEDTCDPATIATYLNNRAAASTMILQYDDAVNDCDEALAFNPSFLKAYIRKSKAQVFLGALEQAVSTLNKASIHDPNNSTIISLRNETNKLQQRIELAIQLLDKTDEKKEYPPFPLPSIRDAQQALSQITIVLASCPAWRDILVHKTKALIAVGKVNDAYTFSTNLIRSNNHHNSTVVLYRAYALHHMGNLDDAIKHLKQILSGDPDNKFAFAFHKILRSLGKKKGEGDGYYKSRNFQQAAGAYAEALDMKGCVALYRAKLYFNRACAYANLRDHQNVVDDCSEALKLDREYVKAITRRANSYLMIGGEEECQKAIRDFESVMELAERKGDEDQQREMKKKLREAQVALKRSKQKDFYKILNVGRDATETEIKKGYRKSALKWHPDRHATSTDEEKTKAETMFREINLAYEVLSDSQKKAKYDSGVDIEDLDNPHAGHGHGHGHGGHGGGGIDPNILFQMFMQQQQGGGGGMGGGMGGGGGGFHFG
jgi:DnaJ family protein C protein 7